MCFEHAHTVWLGGCAFSDGCVTEDKNYPLKHNGHTTSMQKHYDSWAKSNSTPAQWAGNYKTKMVQSPPMPGRGAVGHDFDRCITDLHHIATLYNVAVHMAQDM